MVMLNLLRKEREKKGLTKKKLSELSNCSEQLISDIENSKVIPSDQLIKKIAKSLKVEPEKLFNLYF